MKAGNDIFVQDLIATGEGARAEMVLGGKVLAAIGERSRVTITERPGRGTLNLETGQVALSAEGRRLGAGESSVVMPGPSRGPAIELRANDGITITGQVVGPVRALRPVQ